MLPIVRPMISLFPVISDPSVDAAPAIGGDARAATAGTTALLVKALCEESERCDDNDESIAAKLESMIKPEILAVL